MKFIEQKVRGVFLLEAELFRDERGVFRRQFCGHEFARNGADMAVSQCNISENPRRHTLRGFHYQALPGGENKVLSCVRGSIRDIVVDLRPGSKTYLEWFSVDLSAGERRSLFVPAGCANAWLTLEDDTWIHYMHSGFYDPALERGLRYNDPLFKFLWPASPAVVSAKDLGYPDFVPEAGQGSCPRP